MSTCEGEKTALEEANSGIRSSDNSTTREEAGSVLTAIKTEKECPVDLKPVMPMDELSVKQVATCEETSSRQQLLSGDSTGTERTNSMVDLTGTRSIKKENPDFDELAEELVSQPQDAVVKDRLVNESLGLQLISQISSSDSSDSETDSSDTDTDSSDIRVISETVESFKPPMVMGEIDYRDMPSEEPCDIPFPPGATILPVGAVSHYAEKLILIKALPDTPPLNDGTVLWREDKTSIAKIFETFGPVKSPFYSILVQSELHREHLGLQTGDSVYVVPGNLSVTKYVFTSKLLEEKGCDASWKNDVEVPEQFQEFSDDERELAKKQERSKKRTHKKDNATSKNTRNPSSNKPGSNVSTTGSNAAISGSNVASSGSNSLYSGSSATGLTTTFSDFNMPYPASYPTVQPSQFYRPAQSGPPFYYFPGNVFPQPYYPQPPPPRWPPPQ